MQTSYQLLKKRQTNFPDNDRFKLSVVYALWQLGRHTEAMKAFNQYQILPQPESTTKGGLPEVMPFNKWSLYAALLLKTQQRQLGERILAKLEKQFKTGVLPERQSADIGLASVLALQGKKQQALAQLAIAIKQGWVSDFNQNWWYLQDSPYFQDFKNDETFKQIVAQYHHNIAMEFTPAMAN